MFLGLLMFIQILLPIFICGVIVKVFIVILIIQALIIRLRQLHRNRSIFVRIQFMLFK